MLRNAILQGIAIAAVSAVVGFAFNSFSRNGINPFRVPVKVPAATDSTQAGAEGIRVIDLEEARRVVESGVSVIDARRRDEYDEGHIPGAILFDYYDMGTYRDRVLPLLSNEGEIMVYCSEITCEDSELLANELYLLGFTKLLVFKGGFAEWSGAGLPVERGDL
ncbi:MAG: rhodanese-like domain-containing protein [Candidatus Krumholzibacteria bacterium]|nr:rhodanese-like domain-containing protein [Candidatus Krumholzibacteria bacterium]